MVKTRNDTTMTTRRSFLKKACLSGVCLCGFSSILRNETLAAFELPQSGISNKNEAMFLKWITGLLKNLDSSHLTETQLRQIVKSASIAHHENLDMDNMLSPFKGKLEDFIKFLEEKWDWKVSYEENKQVLIVDENKPFCVCPLLQNEKDKKFPALCYCSEGFAERMFSTVCGFPVNATVISSIQRGNNKCIYRIELTSSKENLK